MMTEYDYNTQDQPVDKFEGKLMVALIVVIVGICIAAVSIIAG